MQSDCEMCGRDTLGRGEYRNFRYDNGKIHRALCCVGCQWIHECYYNVEPKLMDNTA